MPRYLASSFNCNCWLFRLLWYLKVTRSDLFAFALIRHLRLIWSNWEARFEFETTCVIYICCCGNIVVFSRMNYAKYIEHWTGNSTLGNSDSDKGKLLYISHVSLESAEFLIFIKVLCVRHCLKFKWCLKHIPTESIFLFYVNGWRYLNFFDGGVLRSKSTLMTWNYLMICQNF